MQDSQSTSYTNPEFGLQGVNPPNTSDSSGVPEPTIGEIISKANNLSTQQIEEVLAYQRENGVRFGEAAVALGMVNADDVMWALAQQFHYPYSSDNDDACNAEVVVAKSPFSVQAEAFRSIRSHLIMKLYSGAGPRHALSIISPRSGDGKTYFTANLGAAFAQLSGRTLLIDANMRAPRLHEVFNLPAGGTGLSSILSGRVVNNAIQSVKGLPNLFVLPVGTVPPNPLELVERSAFGLLVRELLTKFDRVIVDTPSAAHGMDGAVIAARCGAALVLGRQDVTHVADVKAVVDTLKMAEVDIVGSVLNQF